MDQTLFDLIISQFKALLTGRKKNLADYTFKNITSDRIDVYFMCQKMFTIYICKFVENDISTNKQTWKVYKTQLLNTSFYFCLDIIPTAVSNQAIVNLLKDMSTVYGFKSDTLLELENTVVGFATPHTDTYDRPVKLGVSGGNGSDLIRDQSCCRAGTLGFLVSNNDKYYIVSNSHVFVNHEPLVLDDSRSTLVGDVIVQAGPVDFGCNASLVFDKEIARLTAWTPLFSGATPLVDIALAETSTLAVDVSGQILNIGKIKEANALTALDPILTMEVQKSGRTTGKTVSSVIMVNTSVNVNYSTCNGGNFTINFANAFIVDSPSSSFGAAGDSGSLILDYQSDITYVPNPVGILFAGNSTHIIGLTMKNVLQTADTLLSSTPGSTMVVGDITQVPVPPTPLTCLSDETILEINNMTSVMENNHEFFSTIPSLSACGVAVDNNGVCINILTHSDEYIGLSMPESLHGMNINFVRMNEPFTMMI